MPLSLLFYEKNHSLQQASIVIRPCGVPSTFLRSLTYFITTYSLSVRHIGLTLSCDSSNWALPGRSGVTWSFAEQSTAETRSCISLCRLSWIGRTGPASKDSSCAPQPGRYARLVTTRYLRPGQHHNLSSCSQRGPWGFTAHRIFRVEYEMVCVHSVL